MDEQHPSIRATTQDDVDQAREALQPLQVELAARGKFLPIGKLQMDALLDRLVPPGTQERIDFDFEVYGNAYTIARETLVKARQEALRQGVVRDN